MDKRLSPTDLDLPPTKMEPVLDFELRHPWPERYFGQRFGPAYINKVLKSGRYILCELNDIPEHWPVADARWVGEVLEVYTLQGWRVPVKNVQAGECCSG